MKDKTMLTLALLGGSSLVFAATPGDYTSQFEAMDMDNDGYVAADEVTDQDDMGAAENWSDYDLDADEQLNYSEFANYQWRTAGGAGFDTDFRTMDLNQDAYLDIQEVGNDEALAAGWTEYDLNADQRLDQSEYNQYRIETTGADWATEYNTLDRDRDTYLSETEIGEDDALYPRWSDFDLNDDQRIDQVEYTQYRIETAGGVGDYTAEFSEMDVDSDGYITTEEARDDDELTGNWSDYDMDADDRLDQNEFADYRMN